MTKAAKDNIQSFAVCNKRKFTGAKKRTTTHIINVIEENELSVFAIDADKPHKRNYLS